MADAGPVVYAEQKVKKDDKISKQLLDLASQLRSAAVNPSAPKSQDFIRSLKALDSRFANAMRTGVMSPDDVLRNMSLIQGATPNSNFPSLEIQQTATLQVLERKIREAAAIWANPMKPVSLAIEPPMVGEPATFSCYVGDTVTLAISFSTNSVPSFTVMGPKGPLGEGEVGVDLKKGADGRPTGQCILSFTPKEAGYYRVGGITVLANQDATPRTIPTEPPSTICETLPSVYYIYAGERPTIVITRPPFVLSSPLSTTAPGKIIAPLQIPSQFLLASSDFVDNLGVMMGDDPLQGNPAAVAFVRVLEDYRATRDLNVLRTEFLQWADAHPTHLSNLVPYLMPDSIEDFKNAMQNGDLISAFGMINSPNIQQAIREITIQETLVNHIDILRFFHYTVSATVNVSYDDLLNFGRGSAKLYVYYRRQDSKMTVSDREITNREIGARIMVVDVPSDAMLAVGASYTKLSGSASTTTYAADLAKHFVLGSLDATISAFAKKDLTRLEGITRQFKSDMGGAGVEASYRISPAFSVFTGSDFFFPAFDRKKAAARILMGPKLDFGKGITTQIAVGTSAHSLDELSENLKTGGNMQWLVSVHIDLSELTGKKTAKPTNGAGR